MVPVLTMTEAARHPHNVARCNIVERDGVLQPGPVPRFSATPGEVGPAPRLMLHAAKLSFPHPEGGTTTVEAPPPADFAGLRAALGL